MAAEFSLLGLLVLSFVAVIGGNLDGSGSGMSMDPFSESADSPTTPSITSTPSISSLFSSSTASTFTSSIPTVLASSSLSSLSPSISTSSLSSSSIITTLASSATDSASLLMPLLTSETFSAVTSVTMQSPFTSQLVSTAEPSSTASSQLVESTVQVSSTVLVSTAEPSSTASSQLVESTVQVSSTVLVSTIEPSSTASSQLVESTVQVSSTVFVSTVEPSSTVSSQLVSTAQSSSVGPSSMSASPPVSSLPISEVPSFSSSLLITPLSTTVQPSFSSSSSPAVLFSSSLTVRTQLSSVSLSTFITPSSVKSLMSPSVSNTAAPAQKTPVPVAIIAGAIGAVVIVFISVLCIVCVICCARKKKRGHFVLKKKEKDGTTLAREYKLYEFNEGIGSSTAFTDQQDTTTDTFGIKSPASPIEIDLAGQKLTFPETPVPDDGEALPALIIYNPVKSDELTSNIVSGSSKTLPTRGKQKIRHTIDTNVTASTDPFGGQMKTSKSTSEINKDASTPPSSAQPFPAPTVELLDTNELSSRSSMYDTPRSFKPSASTSEKIVPGDKGVLPNSGEYVTMEPHSKQQPSTVTTKQSPDIVRELSSASRSSDADRLAPKYPNQPVVSLAESLYDNPRLIKSKPLISSEKTATPTSSQEHNSAAYSLYDVPRKILSTLEKQSPKDTEPRVEQPKTSTGNTVESFYDIPKQHIIASHKTSSEPKGRRADSMSDHPTQVLALNGTDTQTKKADTHLEDTATMVAKPPVLPKPSSLQSDKTSVSEAKETTSAPPLLPKPSIAKKPAIAPKPFLEADLSKEQQLQQKSPPSDGVSLPQEKQVESAQVHGENETPTPSYSDQKPSPEGSMASEQLDMEDLKSSLPPKPQPKPRKATRRQHGMPQNVMQELFSKQNSKTKLTVDVSSSPSKPPVKPKPNVS